MCGSKLHFLQIIGICRLYIPLSPHIISHRGLMIVLVFHGAVIEHIGWYVELLIDLDTVRLDLI